MTTINPCGNGLTGTSGTGTYVGANSPTLVTPTLGAALASSINFGGSSLANYVSAGSWTPIDSSGASLSFTGVSASYTRIGNMVFAYCGLTYPSTASGSTALIGGLPLNVGGSSGGYGTQGQISFTTISTAATAAANATATTFNVYTAAGTAMTNVQLSTGVFNFMIIYPVT